MMTLKSYCAKTSQGPYLQVNEDDYDIDLLNKLYAIYDGFGGTGVGDKCVKLLKENIKAMYTKIGGDPDSTFPFFYSPKYLVEGNALINSMHHSHELIKNENSKQEMSGKGGASAICLAMAENVATFAYVGNCKTLLLRKGALETIINPESIGTLAQDYFNSRHLYTTPLNGFGMFDQLGLMIKEYRILPGDLIIMMTDGVYGRISDKEVRYILEAAHSNLESKIEELFKISNSRGNMDNQTTVLLQY
ncbi:MAG: protein serine/threonine phosphatase 2C family protein [Bacteriovoracaceae bacterium]|nr:protein serine/threonine phosphatase 2C family protein [Bacteriovoracaceae bacterium]